MICVEPVRVSKLKLFVTKQSSDKVFRIATEVDLYDLHYEHLDSFFK